MDGLTEGRIVHYVMPSGEHRPAIIVKFWDKKSGVANLTVFPDWHNDQKESQGIFWATSIASNESDKPVNTWHWIEKA